MLREKALMWGLLWFVSSFLEVNQRLCIVVGVYGCDMLVLAHLVPGPMNMFDTNTVNHGARYDKTTRPKEESQYTLSLSLVPVKWLCTRFHC